MRKVLAKISEFQSIVEIPLQANPNYEFNATCGTHNFKFKIQTFFNDKTRISVFENELCVVQNAPIEIYNTNLLLYSKIEDICLFFINQSDIQGESVSFDDLGVKIRLYCGVY